MKRTELTRVFDGSILANKRKEMNYTQKNVASLVGVDTRSYQFWESGSNVPQTNNLLILSKVFDCSIDDFYSMKKVAVKEPIEKRVFDVEKYNKLRKENDLSQEELAMKIDVSVSSVRKWGKNNRIPSSTNVEKIAEVFRCSIDDLYVK